MKLKIKDCLPRHISADEWEITKVEGEYQIGRHIPIESRRKARAKIKGIKILVRESNKTGFFEGAGSAYTGNEINPRVKFDKLMGACSQETLIGIGNGEEYGIESHVDGSYQVFLR